jgi:hypothetical protein
LTSRRLRPLFCAVVGVALTVAPQAHAESKQDVARANALFTAGKALLEAGRYEDACAKFAESKEAASGLGVTLYLADCLERIGRTASAWSEFRSAEGLARERGDRRAEVARERAEKLEPNLCRLTVDIPRAVPRSGLRVQRDGVNLGEAEWGVATPVDPGDHVVVVTVPGRPPRNFDVKLGSDNPTATVRVEPEPDATPAAAKQASEGEPAGPWPADESPRKSVAPAGDEASREPSPTLRYVAIGAGVVGIVGLGMGTAFTIMAKSKLDESNDRHCDAQDVCDAQGLSLRHDALGAADVATVAFIAGGAALASGVVLYLLAPRSTARTGLRVTPVVSADAAGVYVNARF